VNLTTPGQPVQYTFIGKAAQKVLLYMYNGTYAGNGCYFSQGASLTVLNPNGSTLASVSCFSTSAFIDTTTLPQTGTYTIKVNPIGTTGSFTFSLYNVPPDFTGTLTPGTPLNVSITPGQNAVLTFSGTSGQPVTFNITNGTYGGAGCSFSQGVSLTVLNPNGTTLASVSCVSNAAFIDTTTLPQTGTYTVKVNHISSSTGSLTLTLYNVPPDVTGTLTAGTPLNVTIGTPGQNATLTFSGTSGQTASFNITNGTFGACVFSLGVNMTILNPDGTTLVPAFCFNSTASIGTQTLQQNGVYSVKANPNGPGTGSFTITMTSP